MKKLARFFIGVKSEMKKVRWPLKKEMIKYKELNICIDYDKYNLKINYINEMINNESIILTNKIFDDKVTLLVKINENYYDIIKNKLEE